METAGSGAVLTAPDTNVPIGLTAAAQGSGGTLAARAYPLGYYYVVTAVVGGVESAGLNTNAKVFTVANDSVALTWTAVSGATAYKIYRALYDDSKGGPTGTTSQVLVTTLGAVTSYTDTGTAGSAASPPGLSADTYAVVARQPVIVQGMNVFPVTCSGGTTTPVVVAGPLPTLSIGQKMAISCASQITPGTGTTSLTPSVNHCDSSGNVLGTGHQGENIGFWSEQAIAVGETRSILYRWGYDPRQGDMNIEGLSGRYIGFHLLSNGGSTTAVSSFIELQIGAVQSSYWPNA